MEDATRLQKMFNELTGYEKKQIDLKINGIPASPMQIVRAHGVHEEAVYMKIGRASCRERVSA